MGNGTRDTLGNEDAVTLGEVAGSTSVAGLAVLAATAGLLVLHGVDAAHATVGLDELTLARDERSTGRLGGTGEETTHHDGGGAKGKTLDDVADVLDTAVGDAGDAEAGSEGADSVDGSSLGSANGHDLLGDAGRAGAHTNAETVNASGDERSGLLTSDDVSANHIKVRELGLAPLDHLDLVHGVTLGAVQDGNVEASLDELGQTDLVLGAGADSGSAEELLALGQLGGQGEVLVLGQVGARDHGNQVEGLVDNGELALLGLGQDLVSFGEGDAVGSGDEVGDHDIGDGGVHIVLELKVAVGDNTKELGSELAVLCSPWLAVDSQHVEQLSMCMFGCVS